MDTPFDSGNSQLARDNPGGIRPTSLSRRGQISHGRQPQWERTPSLFARHPDNRHCNARPKASTHADDTTSGPISTLTGTVTAEGNGTIQPHRGWPAGTYLAGAS